MPLLPRSDRARNPAYTQLPLRRSLEREYLEIQARINHYQFLVPSLVSTGATAAVVPNSKSKVF